ncbi:hypothetical protein [Geovibrio ferrireducens]|uniref:hypothetical protein n=1 Tax=Geovibrio ferrireducens TaxID=46201 RepID=UPI0022479C5D|nr:hypothetical protein [Geovibrio ferrireducens]
MEAQKIIRTMMWELKNRHGWSNAQIAKEIHVSPKTVENYPMQSIPPFPSVLKLLGAAHLDETMSMICKEAGGVFVRVPEVTSNAAHVLSQLSDLSKDFGGVVSSVTMSVRPDSEKGIDISKHEAREILMSLGPLALCAQELVRHLTEVVQK